MARLGRERRKYDRYNAEAKVHFNITFDFKTKVNYQIIDQGQERILSKKYSGLSKDFSAEGLCFSSHHKLEQGDMLCLEVFVEGSTEPILMDGEVRWSQRKPLKEEGEIEYETGVLLRKVNGVLVPKTIQRDKESKVVWSEVLESVIGEARSTSKKEKK